MNSMPTSDDDELKLPSIGALPDIPDLQLTDLGLHQPEIPTPGNLLPDQRLDTLLTRTHIAFDSVKLDVDFGRKTRGRTFRPLLAIGQAESSLGTPFGVVQLPDGNICVADFMDEAGHARLQLFTGDGEPVRLIRQFEVGNEAEAFMTPAAIAVDAQGNLSIVDMEMGCIKRIGPDGALLAIVGSEGTANNELMSPQGLVIDSQGNLYIADTGHSRILKWDLQGNCRLVLGINTIDEDTGALMAGEEPGQFDEPLGVEIDSNGNLYVADTNNHRVQTFAPSGTFLHAFGDTGDAAGQFLYPERIRVDSSGCIYVSDLNGERIQKFDADSHFVYEILLPKEAGTVADFRVEESGHILVALRLSRLVLKLEVV
jgi:NHL repeat